MSHRISTFKRLTNVPKEVDKVFLPDAGLPSTKDLNSIEAEIMTKFSTIVGCLKDLEGNVLKTSREFLKKTTIEGRENDKIMAVKGNVISNKKKYYKNLEEEVETLSKAFQDQLKKICKEIYSLQSLSQGKTDFYYGSSGETLACIDNNNLLIDLCNYNTPKNIISKNQELPTIKNTRLNEVKTLVANKEKFSVPVAYKVNSSPDKEAPRKFTLRTLEASSAKSSELKKVNEASPKLPLYKLTSENNLPVNTIISEENLTSNFSPLNFNIKENGFREEVNRFETLSDSNREESEGDSIQMRERPASLSLFEDKGSSFDSQYHCKF